MLGVFDPIWSNMVIFHLRYSLCLNVFGLMHIAACEGVDGYCVCVYANGRQTIKIELLKCKGCLIRWFIHIRYGDVRKGPCRPTCDERCLHKSHKEHCVCFLFCFPAGQNSSVTHRSPAVSATVHCSKWVSQRAVVIFNSLESSANNWVASRSHIPCLVWASYNPVTFSANVTGWMWCFVRRPPIFFVPFGIYISKIVESR